MARQFRPELETRISSDAVQSHLKPADPTRLIRDAGFIQGLRAALDLFDEVRKANIEEERQK